MDDFFTCQSLQRRQGNFVSPSDDDMVTLPVSPTKTDMTSLTGDIELSHFLLSYIVVLLTYREGHQYAHPYFQPLWSGFYSSESIKLMHFGENRSVWPTVPLENTKHPLVLSLSSCMRLNACPGFRTQTELSHFASQHKHTSNEFKLLLIFNGLKLVV